MSSAATIPVRSEICSFHRSIGQRRFEDDVVAVVSGHDLLVGQVEADATPLGLSGDAALADRPQLTEARVTARSASAWASW